MLLIVSTLCLKQFETWFFPQIIELLNGYSDDITAYGLSENELFFPNQNIPIKFNKYLWDIHKFVEGDKKNEKYIQNNTDFIWARNLVSLRMQSEECILNPLETVAIDLATEDFARFVSDVRTAEIIVGSGEKQVLECEHHKYSVVK